MKMFTNAAVDTMSKQNSAFDFAKTMMNAPEQVNTRPGPPPAPVETQNQAPPPRPGAMNFTAHPGNRPDLQAATTNPTPMFRESGIDLQSSSQSTNANTTISRPEMKGPQTSPDLENLLSGLKPKIPTPAAVAEPPVSVQQTTSTMGSESIISVSSLKDLDNAPMPKKTRKRNTSNRNNTVSLDI